MMGMASEISVLNLLINLYSKKDFFDKHKGIQFRNP